MTVCIEVRGLFADCALFRNRAELMVSFALGYMDYVHRLNVHI